MCDCDEILKHQPEWEKHYDNCVIKWKRKESRPINKDGTLQLPNKHLKDLECDFLYHLAMDTETHDLPKLFGDVKFVCIGGTKHRMRELAEFMSNSLGLTDQNCTDGKLINLTKSSHRYAMYKVGPILSVNHGIGIPSMSVVLQEILKLLFYAKAVNPIIMRIGTCGGLKVPPGSVIISSYALNGMLEKSYDLPILGKMRKFPSYFDKRLSQEIHSMHLEEDDFLTFIGGTMAADDFYRGQARLDGPFCDHSEEDKMSFLKRLQEMGVLNIEMEATAFAAIVSEAGLRAADICVSLIDRLNGDQVTTSKSTLLEWQKRPMIIVGRYINEYLKHYHHQPEGFHC